MYPWRSIDVQDFGIDLMSISGQKLNCVKGVGFLYVRSGIDIKPIIYGSQQSSRRGGTYPTHLIAAFGKALELTRRWDDGEAVEYLRNQLLVKLQKVGGTRLNGPGVDKRLPNNISLTIDGVKAETLVTMCDLMGVIIAKGSACKSYEPTPSETLMAIGLTEEEAFNTVRISIGAANYPEEIDEAANIITKLIERIRDNG
jgi:cysteine desulfurase